MAAASGGRPARRARSAAPWLLPLLAGRARTENGTSTALLGCYSYGYTYDHEMPNITGQPFSADSAEECQRRCANTYGCSYFGFWQQSKACYLGDASAQMVIAQTLGAVSGPAVCPEEHLSACSAVPGPEFPGSLPSASHRAWPMGHQPTNLQCWPRRANGYPARCATEVTVLEDTDAGWAGRCEGLRLVHVGAGETCQSKCKETPLCGVWATNESTSNASMCWHGLAGLHCESTEVPPPARAQRLMHGSYRELINTMGMQVMNLENAFGVLGNATEETQKCRMVCLSSLLCQHWQYSTHDGCWVEVPTRQLTGYPLVTNPRVINLGSEEAKSVIAGEYIQHTCPDGPMPLESAEPGVSQQQAETTSEVPPVLSLGIEEPAGGTGLPFWVYPAAALAVALGGAAIAGAVLCRRRQKAGGTRAIERLGEDSPDYAHASDGEDAYGMSASAGAPRPPRLQAAPTLRGWAPAGSARGAATTPSYTTPSYTPSFTAGSSSQGAGLRAPAAHAPAAAAPATAQAFPNEALYRGAARSASSVQHLQASVPTTAATPLYSQTSPPRAADGWLPPGSKYSGFGV